MLKTENYHEALKEKLMIDSELLKPVKEQSLTSDPIKPPTDENKNTKNKEVKFSYTKNLPKLTQQKRGFNAPMDKPFAPVGKLIETHTAIEIIKKELPNTKKRLMRSTYRNFLVIEKRNRLKLNK